MSKFELTATRNLVDKFVMAILLISFAWFFSPGLLGQTTVDFKAVGVNIDTVGWYLQFPVSKRGLTQDPKGAPMEVYEIARDLYDYLSVVDLPPNMPFQPNELEPDKENILEEPFENAYVAVTEAEIIIRLGYNFNGKYKVFGFQRLGANLQSLTAPTPLSQYFEMISRALHYRLQLKSSRSGILQDLQVACANYSQPFYTDASCVVKYIESNQLWDNVEFQEALRKIDPITYK